MVDRQRVLSFIAAVVGGDHVQAIKDYYHPDASMQENGLPPRKGRDALVAHEAAALERMRIFTHPVTTFLVDGDRVAIEWTFDMTDKIGEVRRMNEIAIQLWRGDRIAEERFFYDSRAVLSPIGKGEPHGSDAKSSS
ncbi:MAG: nuclear transport factor 2 family protein [Alphaproteobacteria bacterium]|nr:nuclear transport factor 2 family protein [Alphaproteobacteria bacterium]